MGATRDEFHQPTPVLRRTGRGHPTKRSPMLGPPATYNAGNGGGRYFELAESISIEEKQRVFYQGRGGDNFDLLYYHV